MKIANDLAAIRQHLDEYKLALLYVQAPNCGVCTVFHRQILQLLPDFPNVKGIQANIAEVPDIAGGFHVFTAPAVLVFAEGKEIWRSAKFINLSELKALLAQYSQRYSG